MKKICFILVAVPFVFVLQFCSSSKKVAAVPKVTYMANVHPLILSNCTPCHFPPKGNKKPLDTYIAAKTNIDSMIARISRNPGEKGFMPPRHPKLSDSTINVFVQWKNDGLREM